MFSQNSIFCNYRAGKTNELQRKILWNKKKISEIISICESFQKQLLHENITLEKVIVSVVFSKLHSNKSNIANLTISQRG